MAYRILVFPLTDKGFSRWYYQVRIGRAFISTYKKQSAIYHEYNEEEYLARRKLIRQCEALKLPMSKAECLLLEERIRIKRDTVPKGEDSALLSAVREKWNEMESETINLLFEIIDIPSFLKIR